MTKVPLALTEPAPRLDGPGKPAEASDGAASFPWHNEGARARAPYQSERADDIADRLDLKYQDWQRQRELQFQNKQRYQFTIFTLIGWIWKFRAGRIVLVTMAGLVLLMGLLSGLRA
ncbi:hypothetical protein AADZ90_012550 [Aestuariibius sp. 2305UL40-4]|uniref:hypothetical protein n=1 Tax=Aestuariibius violaceus TaxID=3234132 RepID=UPI00345EE783